jgi:3' exoribonuclease, RNase T-like
MNVMIDLETLGTRAGCVILSIGAAVFDEKSVSETFYRVVSVRTCLDAGLTIDPATEKWWTGQSEEAKETLHAAHTSDAAPLGIVLANFRTWLGTEGNPWGNGADFDLPILSAAYVACGFGGPPWKPYNGRCYRTLKNLRPDIAAPKREGVAHNALDDAIFQANHAIALLAALRK